MAHGGTAIFGERENGTHVPARGEPAKPIDPEHFHGFCYFLRSQEEKSNEERTKEWKDVKRSQLGKDPKYARRALDALYNVLPYEIPNGQHEINPNIPSGYTYLLQLIAHDLVDTTVPFWVAAGSGIDSRNMRSARLKLDTLYGGGPTTCPTPFKPAGGQPDFRTGMRLGRVAENNMPLAGRGPCPFRDLPRLRLDDNVAHRHAMTSLSGATTPPITNFAETWTQAGLRGASAGPLDNGAQVYVADTRNDDTLILTQLVVLFTILHNAIEAKVKALPAQTRFAVARTAVTRVYHNVIRYDLLKRILQKEVYDELEPRRKKDDSRWLWDGRDIPLEFSHGAFRFGHAMVRPSYDLNGHMFDIFQLIGGPNVGGRGRDPLPATWVLKWSKFFGFGNGTEPNYSLKLLARQQIPLDFGGLLPKVAEDTPDNLSVRDWLSAAAAQMWKPGELIEALRNGAKVGEYKGLKFLTEQNIKGWFNKRVKAAKEASAPSSAQAQPAAPIQIASHNIETYREKLIGDLPLPLYVLLEAELTQEGERLGALGSIIVGEVLFRCLVEAEEDLARLEPIAKQVLDNAEKDWDEINKCNGKYTMTHLIRLAEKWGKLGDCREIPFIQ